MEMAIRRSQCSWPHSHTIRTWSVKTAPSYRGCRVNLRIVMVRPIYVQRSNALTSGNATAVGLPDSHYPNRQRSPVGHHGPGLHTAGPSSGLAPDPTAAWRRQTGLAQSAWAGLSAHHGAMGFSAVVGPW